VIIMNFNGKVALVTGSSRGLGKATIIELASRGCNVVINYVNSKEEANKLRNYVVQNYKVNALAIRADVSKEDEVKMMIEKIVSEFGKIDILVNNAAISIDNDFYDKTVDEFRRVLEVNLIGTYLVSKYVGDNMTNSKFGKIINVSSTNGIDTPYPSSIDYDASKAGVISLTHNLAFQFAPYVNVNVVASGWINTDATSDMSPAFRDNETDKIYLKRFAEPEEIAKVIAFLASDDASYINNAVIRVDGGC
jgi:3-oxoacyl-[acyl-carrier protein] reductase